MIDTHEARLQLYTQLRASMEVLRDRNASSPLALRPFEAARVLRLATLSSASAQGLPVKPDPDSLQGAPRSNEALVRLRQQLSDARLALATTPELFGIEPPEE